jgi:hypothetical protein
VSTVRRDPPLRSGGRQQTPLPQRQRYESPRLVDYGRIGKLTQTGGITTKDSGSMFRRCL